MFRAMALKELREIWFIVIGAVILYGIALFTAIFPESRLHLGTRDMVPFVGDPYLGVFCCLAAALAFLLGVWQTFGESIRGTYPFLLHRPAGRTWLMGVKLFVGSAVLLLISGVPLLIYGLWAAAPGTHPSPFAWEMTLTAWGFWFVMPVLYFGTFLTGIIQGPWYGARCLPLAASAFILFVFLMLILDHESTGLASMFSLVVDVWMVILIFFVAKLRNYA